MNLASSDRAPAAAPATSSAAPSVAAGGFAAPVRLLLVDDDARLSALVADFLRPAGFDVVAVTHLAQARAALRGAAPAGSFDGLILDLMLPDGDGLAFAAELRAEPSWQRLPLLMLSARGEPEDRVAGLELGADDYLPKPFEPRELLARLKALLRRAQVRPPDDGRLRVGRLVVDRSAREVWVGDRRCELTSHQFDLLRVLAEHAGRVLSRDQIMDALRGHPVEAFDRSIDVHVSRIRAAIEDDPREPRRLLTVRGVGYLLTRAVDA